MKHQLKGFTAFLIAALVLALTLTACKDEGSPDNSKDPGHTHSFGSVWHSNAAQHWKECSCGQKTDIANHIFADGICTVCNHEKGGTVPGCECEGDAEKCGCGLNCECAVCKTDTPHTCVLYKIYAVAATCTAKGNIEYWTCEFCHTRYDDENETTVLTSADTDIAIDENVHDWDEYIQTTEPTCTDDGIKTRSCKRCTVIDDVTETGEPKHHNMIDNGVQTAANCTAAGIMNTKCEREGCIHTNTRTIDAPGHDWHWSFNVIPETFTAPSKDTATCLNCTATNERNGSNPATGAAGLYFGAPETLTSDSPFFGEGTLPQSIDFVNRAASNDGHYTLLISQDATVTSQRSLYRPNRQLTIIGIGGERTIRRTNRGTLFIIGQVVAGITAPENINLTIGNNITLIGRTNGEHGANSDNNDAVVRVENGASFVMLNGSKIMGNTITTDSFPDSAGAAVIVTSGASFTMKGGVITGNSGTVRSTTGMSVSTGGVCVINANSKFIMEGGSVTGNNAINDVLVMNDAGYALTLSGNAVIGNLCLNKENGPPNRAGGVTIASGWTGSVTGLNLHVFNNYTMISAISVWFGTITILMQGADGHTLTADDTTRFGLGYFLSAMASDFTYAISAPHPQPGFAPNGFIINDLGRLVPKPAP